MGYLQREPLVLRFDQYIDSLSAKAIPLEDVCTACEGHGENVLDRTCTSCDGSGVVLNENGRAVIALMSYYTKSKDSDVLLAKRNL